MDIRYLILKEISEGNTPLMEKDLQVEEDEFDKAVNFLSREKYITGVLYADDRPILEKIGPALTEKGEQYLLDKSKITKGLREIKRS
ncbi:YjcQ family protein [Priestia megaterium]|uniref:YjcQ family protein n=1 Tax=Priestia megaterium TaxID=1404 RepID=UPI002FFDFAFF